MDRVGHEIPEQLYSEIVNAIVENIKELLNFRLNISLYLGRKFLLFDLRSNSERS